MTGVKSEVQMSGETVPGSLNRLSFFPHPAWQIQLGTDQSGDLRHSRNWNRSRILCGLLVWAGPGRPRAGAITSKPGPNLIMVGRGLSVPGQNSISAQERLDCLAARNVVVGWVRVA